MAAELTAAHHADHAIALQRLPELPPEVHFALGDTADADPARHQHGAAADRLLITPCRGPYPHADDSVEGRRLFPMRRSPAIANFNEQFTGIFAGHGQGPTTGLSHARRFALGAIFVSQLGLWYRFEPGLDLRVGLKAFLKAA